MKKIFLTILMILIATTSHAAYVYKNGAIGANGANSCTVTFDSTGGDFIIVGSSQFGGAGIAAGDVADNKGNGTPTALTQYNGFSSTAEQFFYWKNASTGTSHTITLTKANAFCTLIVASFSGSDTSSPFDAENGNTTCAATSTCQPGSVSPSVDNEVLITRIIESAGSPSGVPTGYTVVGAAGTDSMAYKIQTTKGAENPTWNLGGTVSAVTNIATFKSGAAVATVVNSVLRNMVGNNMVFK